MNPLRLHQNLYERTDGRLGHRMLGVPVLLLRTTGARTGQPRVNGLTYARDGDTWLVVASNGGSDKAPGWLHNLRADPKVEIQVGRRRTRVIATIVPSNDPEYPRLWGIANAGNRGRYNGYASKTERPIPVVVLRKVGATATVD